MLQANRQMSLRKGISVKPVTQFVSSRLGLGHSSAGAAAETVVIHPEGKALVAEAFYLDGQLDRVTGVADHSSMELEKTRIKRRLQFHEATCAYRIDDAVFSNGRVYTHRMQHVQGTTPRQISIVSITDELDTAVLPLSDFAAAYFGHMVFDGVATSLMAPEFGETYFDTGVADNMTAHVARYWDLFGLRYAAARNVRVRHAWIFDDLGMNTHKSDRLKTMSAKVRALGGERSGHGVFIRRRGWGVTRAPENEAELEDFFAARDFEIVDPREMTVDQIAARICGARLLVGVEGSGMTHGMLALAPGCGLVMLFPPWRFNNMMKDYADGLGLRYGFVVGQGRDGDYRIDPKEILRTLDLVTA